MVDTLVCTTGASLIGTFQRHSIDKEDVRSAVRLLSELKDPIENREFGAEINSVASLIEKGYIDSLQNLYLIVSDTPDGMFIGEVLKIFFKESRFEYKFNRVETKVIKGLNDSKIHDFRLKGLRNLVREMASLAKQHTGRMIINATGGYKAQIAFAVLIGQAFNIPVFYRFERFNHVIELLPLPLTFSDEIFLNYKRIFLILECKDTMEEREFLKLAGFRNFSDVDLPLKLFIDRVGIDGEWYIALNPLGELYLEKVGDFKLEDLEKCGLLISHKSKAEKFHFSNSEEHTRKFIEKYRKIIDWILEDPFVHKVVVKGYSKSHTGNSVNLKPLGNTIKLDLTRKHGTLYMEISTGCSAGKILDLITDHLKRGLEGIL